MMEPEIFESENIGFGDGSTNLDFAGHMVRGDFGKRKNHS
jgi:hypothetical protein